MYLQTLAQLEWQLEIDKLEVHLKVVLNSIDWWWWEAGKMIQDNDHWLGKALKD